ncbi:ABC transporter ATP-binding protein, partial [Stenotrophomonas sp. HMWF003]
LRSGGQAAEVVQAAANLEDVFVSATRGRDSASAQSTSP